MAPILLWIFLSVRQTAASLGEGRSLTQFVSRTDRVPSTIGRYLRDRGPYINRNAETYVGVRRKGNKNNKGCCGNGERGDSKMGKVWDYNYEKLIYSRLGLWHFHWMGKKKVHNCINVFSNWASLVAQMVKNLHAMQETLVLSLGLEDSLEKGIAIHSSVLGWRVPWTEEPGRL